MTTEADVIGLKEEKKEEDDGFAAGYDESYDIAVVKHQKHQEKRVRLTKMTYEQIQEYLKKNEITIQHNYKEVQK